MLKRIGIALALMAAMCMLFSTALAVDASILPKGDEDSWISVTARTTVGDTLYLVVEGTDGSGLYHWTEDMPQAEKLADNVYFAGYFSSMEEVETVVAGRNEEKGTSLDPQYTLSLLFSDGERLLGLNGYNGKIFSMKVENGAVVYEDVAVMPDTSLLFHTEEDYSYLLSTTQYTVAGGKLLYLVEDYSPMGELDYRLLSIDLTSGETKRCTVEFPQRVAGWKDGKALILCWDAMNAYDPDTGEMAKPSIVLYDPAADAAETVGEFPSDSVPYITYSAKLDALVYTENCRITALVDNKTPVQVGYIPLDWSYDTVVVGDTFLDCSGQVTGRTMSLNYNSDVSLNVYGDYMDQGTIDFTSKYPQVPVYTMNEYYGSLEEISQAMVSGDSTIDVLRMTTAYDSFFRLMEKGYCADLSGNAELMAYAERLHPTLREALMKDGKLYALPVYAYSYDGWYVANGVMEEMGLTIDDIPTNFVELCQFATRWNDEWVEEYPQFTLIEYCEDYKQQIFYYMMNGYLNYCTATGQEVRFTSPEFRAMLEALEAMRADALTRGANLENEDEVGYRQGLFMPNYTVVGSFDTASEYRTFIPMTLTADTDYVTGVNMEVVFINPKCENMQEAMNLLLCKLQAIEKNSTHQAYTLFADRTEPLENEYFERNVESMEEYIAQMEEELAEIPEAEKKDYQMMLDSEKEYLEKYKLTGRWSISEEDIRHYHEDIVPNMYVIKPTFMDGSQDNAAPELNTLMERYLAGQIKLEQFIRDADNKMLMMQMEDY